MVPNVRLATEHKFVDPPPIWTPYPCRAAMAGCFISCQGAAVAAEVAGRRPPSGLRVRIRAQIVFTFLEGYI